jgi:hypothetical protein
MNIKAKYNDKPIYIKYMSLDMKYVLVSKLEKGKRKIFKLQFSEVSGLNKKDLNKFKKLHKWKDV